MWKDTTKCPDHKTIEKYFLDKFDSETKLILEDHFNFCEKCLEEARKISYQVERFNILKANSIIGEAWEKYGDMIEEFKSAADNSSKVREFVTRNKKIKITLRPLEDDKDYMLLEVKAIDKNKKKYILLYINNKSQKLELDNDGLVCLLVRSDIDISSIIVRNCENSI